MSLQINESVYFHDFRTASEKATEWLAANGHPGINSLRLSYALTDNVDNGVQVGPYLIKRKGHFASTIITRVK